MLDEELKNAAAKLGYCWPSDGTDEDRQRCLLHMASTAAYWREQAEAAKSEVMRDRMFKHLNLRCEKVTRKLKNTRLAMRDFMKGQAAFVREGLAEIRRERDRRDDRASGGRLPAAE